MDIKPIITEQDYHMAIVRLQLLKDAPSDSQQKNEFDVLTILVEHYERENAPMGMPDPIDSIKIFTSFFNEQTQPPKAKDNDDK